MRLACVDKCEPFYLGRRNYIRKTIPVSQRRRANAAPPTACHKKSYTLPHASLSNYLLRTRCGVLPSDGASSTVNGASSRIHHTHHTYHTFVHKSCLRMACFCALISTPCFSWSAIITSSPKLETNIRTGQVHINAANANYCINIQYSIMSMNIPIPVHKCTLTTTLPLKSSRC